MFGLALILLVWINYFSRDILYAAAWAWTHPLARAERVVEPADPVQGPPVALDGAAGRGERARDTVQEGRLRRRGRGRGGRGRTAVARAGRGDDS